MGREPWHHHDSPGGPNTYPGKDNLGARRRWDASLEKRRNFAKDRASVTPAHCQTGREVEVGHAVARTGHQETPRVLRETEDVETELNNLIANPQGIAQRQ